MSVIDDLCDLVSKDVMIPWINNINDAVIKIHIVVAGCEGSC